MDTPLDTISLLGLRVHARHGVFDFERENGQTFVIDVVVHLDVRPAAEDDELANTVHYGELAERVVAAVENDPVDLIETVAERVAGVALSWDAVQLVDVAVHKPDAPIGAVFDDVVVRITRGRPADRGVRAR
ncbi:dihydroneopterin aldolase [Labedella populi]|uniref:7,8-dihydroneopterin aldolase n=1 Tax=Labedella populi TaxID=2498850 RepID=A0A444Q6J6_9MICO|nr:dihydroneopterin aldolase [Labedella populi]RWZ59526.1 dihydroneopterin aldolase [Labedella populi]